MAELFTPFNAVGLVLKNRIVMSPMCMYSATSDGQITDWHRVHYPTRAVGGVGLILVEATAVESRGRITEQDLGIWSDRQIEGLSEIVRLVHGFEAKIGIQLAHAGRKSQASEPIVAPSELPFNSEASIPRSLTANEIRGIVQAFGEGARRAREAGFDLVEIHAAHGYLINEFLSPLANKREDDYGGSLVNRFRLLGEVISEVRRYWSGALFVRLSAEEYAEGGNHIEESIEIARMLKDLAIDLVDVSSGGVVEVPIEDYPGYQVGFSEQIKQRAEIPTGAVGLITDARQAEGILLQKQADLIFLGRELLRHPYWPLDAARCLEADIPWPNQYEKAKN